jgi:aryl-alcohol dehydrogenase-like predicted oxidoreductase
MRYQSLGNSGLLVSTIGLGCNNFGKRTDLAATRVVVDAAFDAGITLFDTADIYGGRGASEELLGQALAGRRDEVVLATKFGEHGYPMGYPCSSGSLGSRQYIRRAVEGSLRRLRTDYIDLYQYHRPDPATPIEETVTALAELVREGKVRYLGHSNLTGWQIAEVAELTKQLNLVPFVSAQNHWSLLDRGAETEIVPAARHYGLGVLPYYPLANGLLTGKVRRGASVPTGSRLAEIPEYITAERLDRVEALAAWGESNGRSLLEIGLAVLGAQPGCTSVIAGATRPEQVLANAATTDWVPSREELNELDKIVPPPSGVPGIVAGKAR